MLRSFSENFAVKLQQFSRSSQWFRTLLVRNHSLGYMPNHGRKAASCGPSGRAYGAQLLENIVRFSG